MKKLLLTYIFIILLIVTLSFSSYSKEEIVIESVLLSDDCKSITVTAKAVNGFSAADNNLYLFSVPMSNRGSIDGLVPILQIGCNDETVKLIIPFDNNDKSAVLNSYLLAIKNGNGNFVPVTDVKYISNINLLAENNYDYPKINSKKGLQVQLTTDAQLLGVKHTVVSVFLNELITTNKSNSVEYIYGDNRYYIDKTALNMLDYRIKTLSSSGIHIYINFLLSFDTEAPSILYYPDAYGDSKTLYGVNISSEENIKLIASFTDFIVNRYTLPSQEYGFCGSYIIGYEVNNQYNSNSSGISDFKEYVFEYSTLLRTIDLAARSAYANSRIYVSLSNQWNVPSEENNTNAFPAREFLSELSRNCYDVPFRISINPYPSDLNLTDYWNDSNATDNIDTKYLTLKNINILCDYLENEQLLFNGKKRNILIGEFGVSGEFGNFTEKEQAAAFAYAYLTIANNKDIEAMIWHRHVDHSSESGLYYGLYSSGEILLDAKDKKLIHSVFESVDSLNDSSYSLINSLIEFLPITSWQELFPISDENNHSSRVTYNFVADDINLNSKKWKSEYLFDFSESLYSFFPTDNARYLEHYIENEDKYMRANLIPTSTTEYMGVGCNISDFSRLANADYISVKVRLNANIENPTFKLVIFANDDDNEIVIDCSSVVKSGEWNELYFSLDKNIIPSETNNGIIKLWFGDNTSDESELLADFEYIKLYTKNSNYTTIIIFYSFISLIIIFTLISYLMFYVLKRKKIIK